MNPKLRNHLLEESRTMLGEARRSLEKGTDALMDCITDVEQGDYHPLRKQFQRKAVGEDTIQLALKHSAAGSEARKRGFTDVKSAQTDDLDTKLAQVSLAEEMEQQLVSEMADVEAQRIDQVLGAERARIEAERVLARERSELFQLEVEKAELLRLEAEKAEKQRLEAERALEEERQLLAKLAAEKEALRKKIEDETRELERIEKEKALEVQQRKKEMAERLERERLKHEEEERTLFESKRIAKEQSDNAEQERKAKEVAENQERERMAEKERQARIAREDEERKQRIAQEEAERKAHLEREEQARREKFAREEAEQQERLRLAQVEHEERLHALEEAARLEREAEEAERQAKAEIAQLEKQNIEQEDNASQLLANGQMDDEERALNEALAEKELLEQSMALEAAPTEEVIHHPDSEDEEEVPSDAAKLREEEQKLEKELPQAPSALETSFGDTSKQEDTGSEKKYVTIQDRMLQPRKKGLFWKAPRERVLVLREDKFRYFDETKSQLLGGLSLAEEGVEVVLTALKKSPSGVALRFSSPTVGTLEFYPATVDMGRKWISAIEHNMEMRYELPDLGPEEAPTFYDYLGVSPDQAEPPILLQAYADRSRSAQDEWLRTKLNDALQVLHDPFKKVEYDNFVMVQRKYRFGGIATVQIRTPRGEATDPVQSRVFTDAAFAFLYWQDIRLGPSLTGRHLCVELARVQEVQPGPTSNSVQLVLNNGEVLQFAFPEKREAEDFGAAVRFAKSPQSNLAKRRQSVQETSV